MNDILQKLKDRGCDMDQALERMFGDEEFLLDLISQVLADPAFGALGDNLKKQDAAAAFDNAHTLKGICANTGVTTLLNLVVELVEPLRAGNAENLDEKYEKLLSEKAKLEQILAGQS